MQTKTLQLIGAITLGIGIGYWLLGWIGIIIGLGLGLYIGNQKIEIERINNKEKPQ